jgi:tetratricopeptide (TPR) repeat protein
MELLQLESGISSEGVSHENCSGSGNAMHRLLRMVVGIALVGLMIYFFRTTGSRQPGGSEPADDRETELTDLTLDLSLLSQELDELFGFFVQRVSDETMLTPEDRQLLESWLEFDERFIERTQNLKTLKFERVNAHLRLGHGMYLLQMTEPSIAHFQKAIKLLDELIKENPKIDSYLLDKSDAYYGLARSMKVVGRNGEALAEIEAAIKLLSDPRFPTGTGRLNELYRQKRELLAPNVTAQ